MLKRVTLLRNTTFPLNMSLYNGPPLKVTIDTVHARFLQRPPYVEALKMAMIKAIDERFTPIVTLRTSTATSVAARNVRAKMRKNRRHANGIITRRANVILKGAFNGGGFMLQ